MQYHYSSIGSSIWEFLFFSSNYKVIPFQFYKLINSVKFLLTLILDSNLWKKATETKRLDQTTMNLSSWFHRSVSKNTKNNKTPDQQQPVFPDQNQKEEELLGITQQLIDHVKSFTLETFKNFPLQGTSLCFTLEIPKKKFVWLKLLVLFQIMRQLIPTQKPKLLLMCVRIFLIGKSGMLF